MVTFAQSLTALPFTATTPNGRGFLPPIVRAIGHLLYVVGCLADETITKTDDQILTELRHAQEHWDAQSETEAISTQARTNSGNISSAIALAITEFPGWNTETKTNNIRDLVHRCLQWTAELDRELVGILDSDAGSSL